MTDAAAASPAFAKFPPEGFAVVRHVPHVWIPRVGETLQGWICDPRPDCLGILVMACAEGAMTDHGPVRLGFVVHVTKDERMGHLENAPVARETVTEGQTRTVILTHEAAIYCESIDSSGRGIFAVALRLEAPIPEVDALTRALALRKAVEEKTAAAGAVPPVSTVSNHATEPAASADAPAAKVEAPPTAPVPSPIAGAVPPTV